MRYLIDGHNLIPFLPGVQLSDLDDEESLVHLLQLHARVTRSTIEVYFDNAPPGHSGTRKSGTIMIHSIARPAIADTAIISRVRSIRNNPGGWGVVSQDRLIQDACRKKGVRIIDSSAFAQEIQSSLVKDQQRRKTDPPLDASEINGWIKIFSEGRPDPDAKD